jgi:hypothetical protein
MAQGLTVAVLRYDDKFVMELSYNNYVSKLIKVVLEEMPDFRRKIFMSPDIYDEQIAAAVQRAALRIRSDLFAVGLKPKTWVE